MSKSSAIQTTNLDIPRKILTDVELEDYDSRAFQFRSLSILDSSGGKMIKLDIVNLVADRTGVPKQKAEQVVDSLFEEIGRAHV